MPADAPHRMRQRRAAAEAHAKRHLTDRQVRFRQQLAGIPVAHALLEFADRQPRALPEQPRDMATSPRFQ